MRTTLKKLNPKKTYIFFADYKPHAKSQRATLSNIEVYENGEFLGKVNHNHVARKPFKAYEKKNGEIPWGSRVYITGKVQIYSRENKTKDFGIVEIKMKKVVD